MKRWHKMGEMLDCGRERRLKISDKETKPIGRAHRTRRCKDELLTEDSPN